MCVGEAKRERGVRSVRWKLKMIYSTGETEKGRGRNRERARGKAKWKREESAREKAKAETERVRWEDNCYI